MAIVPSTDYAGQTDTDAAYPHGKAKNVTVAGDGTGTPLEKAWVNDLWGFFQELLDRASITPSGDPDEVGTSDYSDALDAIYQNIILSDDGDDYVLVWELGHGAYQIRLYVTELGLAVARNASWLQGTGWVDEGALQSVIEIQATSAGGSITTRWGTITAGSFASNLTHLIPNLVTVDHIRAPQVLGTVSSGATAAVEYDPLGTIDGVTAQSAHLVVDVTSAGFAASDTSVVLVTSTASSVYTQPNAYFDNADTIRIGAPRIVATHAITDLTTDVFTFHLIAHGAL